MSASQAGHPTTIDEVPASPGFCASRLTLLLRNRRIPLFKHFAIMSVTMHSGIPVLAKHETEPGLDH